MNTKIEEKQAISLKMSGEYSFSKIKVDGTVEELGNLTNLITDGGLNRMLSGTALTNWLLYCTLGTGVTTPTNADTTLAALTDSVTRSTGATNVHSVTDPFSAGIKVIYTFPVATVARTYSEVGVGADFNALNSRALISPTINIAIGEQIIIAYTLKFTIPTTSTGTISGYGYTVRPCATNDWNLASFINTSTGYTLIGHTSINSYAAGFVNTTTMPGSNLASTGVVQGTYTPLTSIPFTASYTLTAPTVSFSTIVLNLFGVGFYLQINFDTPIPKTSSNVVGFGFSLSLTR